MPVGVLLALAVVMVPALSQEGAEQPQNPWREVAERAGCDLSQDQVAMGVATNDYVYDPTTDTLIGSHPTVEQAVLAWRESLAEDGAAYSAAELRAAVAAAPTDRYPIEVRLPGASISVDRFREGSYVVSGFVICA